MLVLKENRFMKDGVVKYEDDKNNRLMIIADKQGSILKIKVRPGNGLKVESIHLKFPFDEDGLNFKIISSPAEIVNSQSEDFMDLLHNVIEVAENWVAMAYDIHILTNNSIPLTEDEINKILDSLYEHEEMKAFVNVYKTLLKVKNK